MRFFIAIFVFASALVVASCADIVDPAAVLDSIADAKARVKAYQEAKQADFATLESSSGAALAAHYDRSIQAAEDTIKGLGESDDPVKTAIAAETPNPCFTNLLSGTDRGTEWAGYAASVCTGDNDPSLLAEDSESSAAVAELQKAIDALPQVIVNALIGRNAFTEPDAIVARIEELLAEEQTKIDALLTTINDSSSGATSNYDKQFAALQACNSDAQTSFTSLLAAVQSQIAGCAKFGTRGARSAAIPVEDFFPQLKGRLPIPF